jgi:hypothetical protein
MAKTYYNFAERSADSQINWAEVGKNVTEMLQTEAAIREEKKAAIDEASRQYGEVLANAPTGDFKAANEWTLDYANDAAQIRLMQDRLLKSGQLSVRDYTVNRQNLYDGTQQMFAISKEYQEKYKEVASRYQKGESQEFEAWLMEQEEGLSNFTNTKAYINPANGQVSIAKMVKKVGADGNEVFMMDDNPDNYVTVNQLRNRMNVRLDKYDYVGAVGNEVDALGDFITTNMSKFKQGYRMIRIDQIEDQKLRTDYKNWEDKMVQAQLANPFNQLGLLTDSINKVPGTNEDYTFTYDAELAKTNTKYILIEDDGSGMTRPKFTEAQTKVASDFLRTQTRQAIDQKIESDLQAEPSIQYPPNYGDSGSGNKPKNSYGVYERSNQALRTGNLASLNNKDYTFIFKPGKNGEKNSILVAPNVGGVNIPYNKNTASKFKTITSARDVSSYLMGIDPKQANSLYQQGATNFKGQHGFELFGNYFETDNILDVYDPSLYTEAEYSKRRGSGGGSTTTKTSGGASNSGGNPR